MPFWMRLLVWIVAVPLGFVIVFGVARGLGFLTQTQLEDVFLETGWDRFWPVARLLPVRRARHRGDRALRDPVRSRDGASAIRIGAVATARDRGPAVPRFRKSQTRGSSDAQTPSA